MVKRLAYLAAIVCLSGGGFLYLSSMAGLSDAELKSALPETFVKEVARGELIFHMGGCAHCHSQSDNKTILIGGKGLETDFGTFYAPNISPDKETGIGAWSDADFVNAMREGISPEGRHYYPSFPYLSYAQVSLNDLLHLKAYLETLPVAHGRAPKHQLFFPFNIRPALAFWKVLAQRDVPDNRIDNSSEGWERGQYIVNGIGHCGVCHTPRDVFFVEDKSRPFMGAKALKDGEKAAPRIAGLDADKVLNALSEWSGAIDERSSMYLVTLSYSHHVPLEDHEAIADYLARLEQ